MNNYLKEETIFLFNQNGNLTAYELFQLAESSYPNGSPWPIESYKSELAGSQNKYGIALQNAEKVGFIGYTQLFDEVEITTFGILKPFKNQGIGQSFLRAFIKQVKSEDIKTVFLEVREQNKAAIAVYEKVGFEMIALRKNYYHDPVDHALIMQLKI
ncbi:ribosomal protein S18-alanine N-acetyltransferase [Carnobacterium sp.]|uniref:ribosomal protein S18-alanine N-acetyltransferase n=1 Tax=Carnobacterium sp. TaxID=48221 RepID=UPI00388EBD61